MLKAAPPQPGQQWIFTVQPLWAGHSFYDCICAEGFAFQTPAPWGTARFIAAGDVPAVLAAQAAGEKTLFQTDALPSAIPVCYKNPAKGYVSLAICDAKGAIVRTLLTKDARPAGTVTDLWDGLDDDGHAVPAGRYTLKALTHPGITARYVTSVMASGNPAWGNGSGHYAWGADHGNPIGAAADPQGNVYLLWTLNEGGDFLIKVDAQGQKQWGIDVPFGDFGLYAVALTYDNGLLYVAKDGKGEKAVQGTGGLIAYDAATGRRVTFPGGGSSLPVTTWPATLLEGAADTGTPAARMRAGAYSPADLNANLVAIAAGADRWYCALYLENTIVALDKKDFTVRARYTVPHPAGLAFDATAQRLYAVSGQGLVSIDPVTGVVTPLVDGLDHPYGLTLDAAGILWVSVRGTQMQVRGYTRAGVPVRTIGTTGGRPWVGKYDRNGLLLPAGLCVDARGRLWVTEYDNMPKRISVWNTTDGRFLTEYFGAAAYAPMMVADPQQPEAVYINNTRFLVDYDRGTAVPDATIYRSGYIPGQSLDGPDVSYGGFMGNAFRLGRIGGKSFAYNGLGGFFRVDADHFTPVMGIRGGKLWVDRNHDGAITDDECSPIADTHAKDWTHSNLLSWSGNLFPDGSFLLGGYMAGKWVFRPTGLDRDGVPVFDFCKVAPVPAPGSTGPMAAVSLWDDVWPSIASRYRDYYAIAAQPVGTPKYHWEREGVYRFTPDGTIRWRYARTAIVFGLSAPLAKTGDLFGAIRIIGELQMPKAHGGEILGIGCYRGYFAFLNEDGLFIDMVGNDNGRGPAPSPTTFYIENFSGSVFRHPRTGKVYLFCGDVDGRILELQGWDNIRRFTAGTLTVTPAQYQATVAMLRARTVAQTGAPLLAQASSPSLNGLLAGWNLSKLRDLPLDETHHAQVGVAYDAMNLYALFKVPDNTPWKNAATDWRYCFKGGDAVDIQLGTNVPGETRTLQPGDVRVLLTPAPDGAGVQAVGMWPKVLAGMDKAPQRYQSPTGQQEFERVALIPHLVMKLQTAADGYTLEVAIPWRELGLSAPAPGAMLQGDVGVLLSDASGTVTTMRRYLFNTDTTVINDIPTEVRMNCGNWGKIAF